MKVLVIISTFEPTGEAETFAVNFSREFQQISEFKVFVLYQKHKSYFEEKIREANVVLVFLDKTKRFDLKNAKKMRQIINEFEPDIIHTENNALIPAYLALRSIKKSRLPKVFYTMRLKAEDETANKKVRVLYKHIFHKPNFIPVAITKSLSEEEAKKYSFITYFGKTFHISGIESYERLQQYDLYTFPSHFFQECAPGSILDMFIAGVPTLSSLFPNALNVMNERNSYFFEFKNFDDLVAKLDYIYVHKEELNAKRIESNKEAHKYFPATFIKFVEDLLNKENV